MPPSEHKVMAGLMVFQEHLDVFTGNPHGPVKDEDKKDLYLASTKGPQSSGSRKKG